MSGTDPQETPTLGQRLLIGVPVSILGGALVGTIWQNFLPDGPFGLVFWTTTSFVMAFGMAAILHYRTRNDGGSPDETAVARWFNRHRDDLECSKGDRRRQ